MADGRSGRICSKHPEDAALPGETFEDRRVRVEKNSKRRYYLKNREKILAWTRSYHRENADKEAKQRKAWYAANAQNHKALRDRWRQKNADRNKQINAAWQAENKEKCRAYYAAWRLRDLDHYKTLFNIKCAEYRARKIGATPPWADKKEIAKYYRLSRQKTIETGVKHNVDHIVPLKSDVVCGLHVPWNLAVITAAENFAKGNKLR